MRQPKYSPLIICCGFMFVVLGGLLVAAGVLYEAGSQQQWVKIIAALVGFSGGFLLLEMGIRKGQQQFNQAVSRREKELGRPLLPDEREQVKAALRAAMPKSEDPGIHTPWVHLMAKLSLVLVPVALLLAFVSAVGGFCIGLGVAVLLAELNGRSLDNL